MTHATTYGIVAFGGEKVASVRKIVDKMERQPKIETKLANGFDMPEPVKKTKASGKFTLRVPKSLHQRLTIEAKKEGISLNQYALYKLSS